ncbi:HAD hydrolase family protein [Phenylobacterium sp. LH3H17]|uniref:HAD hydrolase family protein n=1 Tax=Phenylobacterium sp. LH3H17 TaxID=2903901 RepID=UPI0020C9ED26|nr:HAD hydrolase family protein [Phenylobacterium sp. LH3H17]UTP39795.1 HAD hydrolase family protein [Phenylobacterium sp. LH3H17]
MAKPYATEISKLRETFSWANAVDLVPLRQAVRTAGLSPLRAIGSGGSLTAAHALAGLHQRWTGRVAAVATPLDAVAEPLEEGVATWLLSAGGGNVDILAAFKALVAREPRQLGVLCGRSDSALADLGRDHAFVDLLLYEPPAGKDGFLATNSLLAFTALLTRAYALEFAPNARAWEQAVAEVEPLLIDGAEPISAWARDTSPLWERPTTLILHGSTTRIGAVDLESKFTEAALGNLHLADYRNFAHGRHHWLAKRGEHTAIIAFLSDEDRALAERTLALIPQDIPQARLELPGSPAAASIASLIAALRITGWAGVARGIDPGRPGVPEFGRKLYNLPLPKPPSSRTRKVSDRAAVAITRKAGLTPERLEERGQLDRWRAALTTFEGRLRDAAFAGVVLDYDGTIVDARHRFFRPRPDIAAELGRLAESGAQIAIATGRGASVRRDLQASLPQELWPRILIGYYNGAEIAALDDSAAPDGGDIVCDTLAALAVALRAQPELADAADQTDRRYQITLEAKRAMPENRLWDLAHQVVLMTDHQDARITRSSHSIDIVAAGVSKLNVLERVRVVVGAAPLLTIGDRGRWPGNDYELLREPYALSVDEISVDPTTCWNLAVRGQRGVAATLDYLRALRPDGGCLRFDPAAFR